MGTADLQPKRVNFWRHAQAVGLLPLLVEAGLGANEYTVVQLLGRLMRPETDESGSSKWFITLPEIVDATLLSESTVRRALDNLIDKKFLRKTYRPHRGKAAGRKPADGIGYNHCVYHTMPLWCDIPTRIDKGHAAEIAKAHAAKSGTVPKPAQKAVAVAPGVEEMDFPKPDKQADADADRVYKELARHLGNHASMKLKNSEVVMRPTIDAFLSLADVVTVCHLLGQKLTPEMVERLSGIERLGGYLAPCATGWVAEYLAESCATLISFMLREDFQGAITAPNVNDDDFKRKQPTLERALRKELGDDLIESSLVTRPDGVLIWNLQVSAEYREEQPVTAEDEDELDPEAPGSDDHLAEFWKMFANRTGQQPHPLDEEITAEHVAVLRWRLYSGQCDDSVDPAQDVDPSGLFLRCFQHYKDEMEYTEEQNGKWVAA